MLTNIQKRLIAFLGGCIIVRSLIAYLAYSIDSNWLPLMGLIALIPVIGWLYIYFVSPRNTGPEVFGGTIWWNKLRPLHAMFWLAFAISAFYKWRKAYLFLVFDVFLGLLAFLLYHLGYLKL
jgi:hypothetical protein